MTLKHSWIVAFSFALLSATSAFAASEASSVKVDGFVDAQASIVKGAGSSGISVVEGAVFLSKELDGGSAFVDIPYLFSSKAGSFDLGLSKAQAYAQFKYKNGFMWRMGQFHKSMGIDLNDAIDNTFTSQTILYTALPVVHAGAMIGYSLTDDSSVNVYGAAPGNNTSIPGGQNPDFGANYMMQTSKGGMKAGVLFNNDSVGTNFLGDVDLNWVVMTDLTLSGEALVKKPKVGDTGFGFLVQGQHKLMDSISVAVRGEMASKVDGIFNRMGFAVGPQFTMTKDLGFKVDYILASVKALDGFDAVTGQAANFAAQYRF